MGAKYTEAQARATAKYQKEKLGMVSLKLQRETKERWKVAASRNGLALQRYIIDAVEDRIARESSQDAAILAEVIKTVSERPYTVTFRTSEVNPSGTVKASGKASQKVVQASSAEEAQVAFFDWLIEQTQGEVAFRKPDRLGIRRGEVIEVCTIVSVE